MTIRDEDIRQRFRLGEDSFWEFKQIEFKGDTPVSPRRGDLANEMGAFANASGGVLLCGVSDDGQIQGMSRDQMAALDNLLVEVCTDAVEPAMRIGVTHRQLDGRAFLVVEVPQGDAVHERAGQAFVRVGASKRRLDGDERLRLAPQDWLPQATVDAQEITGPLPAQVADAVRFVARNMRVAARKVPERETRRNTVSQPSLKRWSTQWRTGTTP